MERQWEIERCINGKYNGVGFFLLRGVLFDEAIVHLLSIIHAAYALGRSSEAR